MMRASTMQWVRAAMTGAVAATALLTTSPVLAQTLNVAKSGDARL